MTKRKGKTELVDVKELLEPDEDFLQAALQALLQAALEAEMGRERGAYRDATGLSQRLLSALIGDAGGDAGAAGAAGSRRALFDRAVPALPAFGEGAGRHSGRDVRAGGIDAQKPALAKAGVKAVTEALCGHSFSASAISAINKSLDETLRAFAERRLDESFPCLIIDARYEKVREAGIIVKSGGADRGGGRWRGAALDHRRRSRQPGAPLELA
jgi:putative transposase